LNTYKKTKKRSILNILGVLVLANAATTIYQMQRIAFYDFNFIQNVVQRMYKGQLPYIDFDLPIPIFPFLIVYTIGKAFKLEPYFAMYISSIIVNSIATCASFGILNKLSRSRSNSRARILEILTGSSFIVINVFSIYPSYFYDAVASSFSLVSIYLLIQYQETKKSQILILFSISCALTVFSKPNVGIFLIMAAILYLLISSLRSPAFIPFEFLSKITVLLIPTLAMLAFHVGFLAPILLIRQY
jgi:hypothetical protein